VGDETFYRADSLVVLNVHQSNDTPAVAQDNGQHSNACSMSWL